MDWLGKYQVCQIKAEVVGKSTGFCVIFANLIISLH